eukprot:scaffold421463_cov35-Attheya_sp.AAC.1
MQCIQQLGHVRLLAFVRFKWEMNRHPSQFQRRRRRSPDCDFGSRSPRRPCTAIIAAGTTF